MTALAIQHRETILEQLASGRLLKQIAKDLGVSKQAIQAPLANDPEYKAALEAQADALIQDAMVETWEAREALDIARAREMRTAAFRYAESVDAKRWSVKHQVEHSGHVSGPAFAVVVQGDCTVSAQSDPNPLIDK